MNKNLGMFLVFIALILLSVLVVNGLYFNNPTEVKTITEEKKEVEEKEDYITTNLTIKKEKKYEPEVAEVILGFRNESKKQSEAVTENNRIVSELMNILEEEKLENVETTGFRVFPYTRYEETNDIKNEEKSVRYYRVNNEIKFSSKNLSELPVLLGRLLDAGANRVVNINYKLESNEKALNEVTESALATLNQKASFIVENLAKENYQIKEINFGNQNIYGNNSVRTMANTAEKENDSFSQVPLTPEKVTVSVSVTAEIEMY